MNFDVVIAFLSQADRCHGCLLVYDTISFFTLNCLNFKVPEPHFAQGIETDTIRLLPRQPVLAFPNVIFTSPPLPSVLWLDYCPLNHCIKLVISPVGFNPESNQRGKGEGKKSANHTKHSNIAGTVGPRCI